MGQPAEVSDEQPKEEAEEIADNKLSHANEDPSSNGSIAEVSTQPSVLKEVNSEALMIGEINSQAPILNSQATPLKEINSDISPLMEINSQASPQNSQVPDLK